MVPSGPTRGVQELDQAARRRGPWLSIARHDSIAVMLASLLYLVLRRLLTLVAPNHRSDHVAQIEILVLRHQLEVLRRQTAEWAVIPWARHSSRRDMVPVRYSRSRAW